MTQTPELQEPAKNNKEAILWTGIGILLLLVIVGGGFLLLRNLKPVTNAPVNQVQATLAIPSTATTLSTQSYTPVFESASCPFQAPEGANVTCGYVVVPEDRNGNLIDSVRLAVAVYHSTSSAPKPDPIVYLQGGPGGNALDWSRDTFDYVIAPLINERDFIVFDPRGVGYSQPSLDCDQFRTTYFQDIEGKIPAEQKASFYEGALLSCKNQVQGAGANLATYTSVNIAADAKDILLALGYKQANLYGISYGTRVAQLMMRDAPEIVRSAILDSVVPLEIQLLNQNPEEQDAILQTLFEDCQADAACATAYPDLEAAYQEVMVRLDAQPVTLPVALDQTRKVNEVVDGKIFRDTVLWSLRFPQMIPIVPALIERSRNGDHSMLTVALSLPLLSFEAISSGMYISVNCHEQVFALSIEKLDRTIYEMCKLWDFHPPASGENDPLSSSIPTLIFAGRYDSVTPPSFASQLSSHLENSWIAEVRNQGHAPSATKASDCPTQLISAFLQDPGAAPDLTCLGQIEPPRFLVPYDGSAPLKFETVTVDQYQVQTRLPVGWTLGQFGFYNRGAWLGDLTQIGVQRAPVSEADWIAWLTKNFGTTLGLDSAPVAYDQHQANGMMWTIYKTSTQGNPIDMAFAKSGADTLLVLLISYGDEHDALYKTVFLPILDSTRSLK